MFIGHLALGLAATRATPRVSLAVLFSASQFADMLWPILVALGVEQVRIDPGNTAFTPLDFISYPYSHSLLALIIWGVVFAAVYVASVRLKPDATETNAMRAPKTSETNAMRATKTSVVSGPSTSSGPPRALSGGGFSRTFWILAALVVSHWVLDWITHRPDMPLYPGGPKYGLALWNSVPATVTIEVIMFAIGVWIYVRATRARDAIGRWAFIALAAFLAIGYVAGVGAAPPPSVTALVTVAIVAAAILTAWSWWADRHRDVYLRD